VFRRLCGAKKRTGDYFYYSWHVDCSFYGEDTIIILEQYSEEKKMTFDTATARNDCAYLHADLSTCTSGVLENSAVYASLRENWKEVKGKGEVYHPYAIVPQNNGYVQTAIKYCAKITPVQGRCTYSVS